jgi:hypothetical protein
MLKQQEPRLNILGQFMISRFEIGTVRIMAQLEIDSPGQEDNESDVVALVLALDVVAVPEPGDLVLQGLLHGLPEALPDVATTVQKTQDEFVHFRKGRLLLLTLPFETGERFP